jgi:hypothetical protein
VTKLDFSEEETMSEKEQEPSHFLRIPLDGTYGGGPMAEITIYTRVSAESNDVKEETFQFPYDFIDQAKLVGYNAAHLIAGYKILKLEKPSALRELGL